MSERPGRVVPDSCWIEITIRSYLMAGTQKIGDKKKYINSANTSVGDRIRKDLNILKDSNSIRLFGLGSGSERIPMQILYSKAFLKR
jgi:hypothetical protein